MLYLKKNGCCWTKTLYLCIYFFLINQCCISHPLHLPWKVLKRCWLWPLSIKLIENYSIFVIALQVGILEIAGFGMMPAKKWPSMLTFLSKYWTDCIFKTRSNFLICTDLLFINTEGLCAFTVLKWYVQRHIKGFVNFEHFSRF